MPIVLRDCTLDDMPAVRDIYCSYIGTEDLATFEETKPSLEEMIKRRDKVLCLGLPWLVATVDDAIIGYCYATNFHDRSIYRLTVSNAIYLHLDHRGKCVGSKLLAKLLECLKSTGFKQVVAVVATETDNPGTHGLHLKFGFKQIALLSNVGFKNGRWVDRVYMQLSLCANE
jgi:phosphinothricin acetyltransferase